MRSQNREGDPAQHLDLKGVPYLLSYLSKAGRGGQIRCTATVLVAKSGTPLPVFSNFPVGVFLRFCLAG